MARLARELSEEAFAPHDLTIAQESVSPERYVEILAELKPTFIHHPLAKELIAGLLPTSAATSTRPTSTFRGCERWRTAST